MEQEKLYKLSRCFISTLMGAGVIFLLLCFVDIRGITSHIFTFIFGLFFSFVFIGYAIYLWRKRNEDKGYFWDDEGVVIDLEGNKFYWDEIEKIKLVKSRVGKSTVIYPHYTNHEKIRIRRKKKMPTPAHSIEWFQIEKPKEFHKNLMKYWGAKSKIQKLR
ncbi:hypothetical protein ACQKMK_12700 [Viridibacillus arvi]|uniref:hypothetical protein n=1 Tax=Viridibacillus arvi TaxID=263475 RepID=UPI003D04FCE9